MSVRAGPATADFLYRGTPGGADAMPTLGTMSVCGLAYHHGAYTGGYETLVGMSKRFTGGQFIFFGIMGGSSFFAFRSSDAGGETAFSSGITPAINTWFQWAFTLNAAGNAFTGYWKNIGAPVWNTAAGVHGSAWVPDTLRLGTDEYDSSAGNWSIDNVRVWNRVLTGAQLLAEVNSADVVDSTGLFEWWKLRPENVVAGSANGLALHLAGASAADADSPLEATPDVTGSNAVGFAVARRWSGAGSANVPAAATGAALDRAWTASGAGAVPIVAHGAATSPRWTAAGLAGTLANAIGAAISGRWRGRGTATSVPAAPPVDTGVIRRRSAMGALQLGIDAALQGNDAFVSLVADRVYSLGTVPKNPVAPYVELGDSSERSSGYFGQGGNIGEETITLVTPKAGGKPGVGLVLSAMYDALDGRRLSLDGHTVLSGRVELVTMFVDPDVANIRTVCRYTATSWTTQTA